MKTFLHDYQTLIILIGIMAICLISAILLLRKGIKDAKEIDDNSALLTQGEIDAYMNRTKDKHLKEIVDRLGKKMVAKQSIEEIVNMPDKKKASQMIIDRAEGNHRFGKQDQCGLCGHMNEEICNTCPDLPGKPEHIEDYPVFDKQYLDECIEKATPNLSKIKDVDECIREIRGGNIDRSENKRGFQNRSDRDEVDCNFLSHIN